MALALNEALSRLASASKQPARARSQPIDRAIRVICNTAYESGLSEEAIDAVVGIVRKPSYLDQNTVTDLIKNLYPASKVGVNIIYDIVASIGPGNERPSISTQSLLLQWLLLVKDCIEEEASLLRCYGVLFNQMHVLGTRPSLSHLLAVLTRRRHVQPWRVRVLLDLARSAAVDAGLLSLLRIYKDFNPNIVIDQPIGRLQAAGFKTLDSEWRNRLFTLQQGNADANEARQAFRVIRRNGKRSRVEVIPEVYTANASEDMTTLEEIDGVKDFASRLDKLEPPSQMISALDDPLLQKYLYLTDKDRLRERLDMWLSFYLDSQLHSSTDRDSDDRPLLDVFGKILTYAYATQHLPSSVLAFLNRLLDDWDGERWQDAVLQLFTFLPLQPFQRLYDDLLSRLENCILAQASSQRQGALLRCYSGLFRNWTMQLLHRPSEPSAESLNLLGAHASLLATQVMATEPLLSTAFAVVQYFAATAHTAQLSESNLNLRILTPNPHVLYLLAFQPATLAVLSPLCKVLATYKIAFEGAMAALHAAASQQTASTQDSAGSSQLAPSGYPRDYVNGFNGFLMDICNLLWRARAFNRADTNARGCLVAPAALVPLRTYLESRAPPQSLAAVFAMSHHPAVSAVAIAAMRAREDAVALDIMDIDAGAGALAARHAGPVTLKSLAQLAAQGGIALSWSEYRLEVLLWLQAHGCDGVPALMFGTMKLLSSTSASNRRSEGSAIGVSAG